MRGGGAWFIACMRRVSRSWCIAILLWADYSRFAMGTASAGCSRRFATRETIPSEMSATTIPAAPPNQKWLAAAMTQNQTQAGQIAHASFDHRPREARKRKMPTIKASAAWRLGIAAYGLARGPKALAGLTPSP